MVRGLACDVVTVVVQIDVAIYPMNPHLAIDCKNYQLKLLTCARSDVAYWMTKHISSKDKVVAQH